MFENFSNESSFGEYHNPHAKSKGGNRKGTKRLNGRKDEEDSKIHYRSLDSSDGPSLFEKQFNLIQSKAKSINLPSISLNLLKDFEGINKIPVTILHSNSKGWINDEIDKTSLLIKLYYFDDTMQCIHQKFLKEIKSFYDENKIEININNLKTTEDLIGSMNELYTNKHPIIVLIYDLEKFNMVILNKLIVIVKKFPKMNFQFILFSDNLLAANLNNYLPLDTVEYLYTRVIEEEDPKKDILTLLDDLIIDYRIDTTPEMRMKFHPMFLKDLMEQSEISATSFENFMIQLKIYVFYYFSNFWSAICDQNFKEKLTSDKTLQIRFKDFLDPVGNRDQNMSTLAEDIIKSYDELLKSHREFTYNLQFLLWLFDFVDLPMEHLSHYYVEIYQDCPHFDFRKKFLIKLYAVTKSKMKKALEKFKPRTQYYENNSPSQCGHRFLNIIHTYKAKLDSLIEQDVKEETKQAESIQKLGLECQVEMVKDKLRNINSRYEWRQNLKPIEKKTLSRYEQWKQEFLENIENLLIKTSQQLFVDEKSKIDKLFCNANNLLNVPSCRQNLEQALSFKTMAKDNHVKLGSVYPTFYILYSFFKEEKGHQIDLQEWFQNFCEEKKLNKQSNKTNDVLIAQFFNMILDFEYIGLLKSSTRQTKFSKSIFL